MYRANEKFTAVITILLLFTTQFLWAQRSSGQQSAKTTKTSNQIISPFFTGDGGKGMSITIIAPKPIGLTENQNYLPNMVAREFVNIFTTYSAIKPLDYGSLGEQYDILLSGYFDDNSKEILDLGKLHPTTHQMSGNITRTATGFTLQMQITNTNDKMTIASYSGAFTFTELENFTGIRSASLDLIQKMGVVPTERTRTELTKAADINLINGQTALARASTAQRQGTEVAALSYYLQAATYDPSLKEASSRSSILDANITSGNMGDNVRNDIAWRTAWVTRLTETEQYFDSFNKTESMPYTLFYTNEYKQGATNYQNETISISIETYLYGSGVWAISIERSLQAVYNGLNKTGRKETWQLGSWPRRGVTELNAFARRSKSFSVVFELLNDQDKVIGRQTLQTSGSWGINAGNQISIDISSPDRKTLNFQNVSANDITEKMTVRVVSINGIDAGLAAIDGILQIRPITKNEVEKYDKYNFSKGELKGFTNNAARDAEIVINKNKSSFNIPDERILNIPNIIWGDPVLTIADSAFKGLNLTDIEIPNGVITIGKDAFSHNNLKSVTIANSITNINEAAFHNILKTVGNDVNNFIRNITIGSNVVLQGDPFAYRLYHEQLGAWFDNSTFLKAYNKNNKKAGTYSGLKWKYTPPIN